MNTLSLNSRHSTKVSGLLIIEPQVYVDFRGEFVEVFNAFKYQFYDLDGHIIEFVEDDISVSRRNVLRGLHASTHVWKLVQCLYGEVYCVVADLRARSQTHLSWEATSLSDRNRKQLLIPAGCATGILCMSENCVFSYKQSAYYVGAEQQQTIRWNDPKLNIYWPIHDPIVSQRDYSAPLLS